MVELGHSVAAPFGGQPLAILGARVIKVENPINGDDARSWGPPFWEGASACFQSLNREKLSITVDFKDLDQLEDLKQFIDTEADIVVQNQRPGLLQQFGLDGESLRNTKPSLIYCNIGAFGADGPLRKKPGYDPLMQAFSGIMSITGPPGEEPHRVGVPIADLTAGLWAALSITAALRHREVTGEGQHLDISLLDTQVSMLSIQGLNYLTSGEVPGLLGNAHPNIVPYQVFPTADGNIIVAVGNDDQFKRFCEFAEVPELISDERFVTNKARVQNRQALTRILNDVMRQKPSAYWLEALEKIKITCGPINTIHQVFTDDQVVSRNMQIQMDHPSAGGKSVNLIGSPVKLSASEVSYRYAPPTLGQHTDEVLEELLGLGAAERDRLRDQSVI